MTDVQYDMSTSGGFGMRRPAGPQPDLIDRFLVQKGIIKDRATAEKVVVVGCAVALLLAWVVWHNRSQSARQLSPAETAAQIHELGLDVPPTTR